jgi:hypothetical protein
MKSSPAGALYSQGPQEPSEQAGVVKHANMWSIWSTYGSPPLQEIW